MAKRIQLEITTKGGAVLAVTVESFKFTQNLAGGKGLEWVTPEGGKKRRLVHLDMDEVAALVEIVP